MHSHHSHSGLYISHAVDDLDSVLEKAYTMGFQQFCLTEHMPRYDQKYLYPEEVEKAYSCLTLSQIFTEYTQHARKLQKQYEGKMLVLVGFEVEGVDVPHIEKALKLKPDYDMIVGSVHHVFGIAIDFDPETWIEARRLTKSDTSRELYAEYFDLQKKMLTVLEPNVVGHFDLIRLFHPDEIDPTTGKRTADICIENDWPEVWQKIIENIEIVVSYGGLFELNSAAIRKGWNTPYPKEDITHAIIERNGRMCLSDDSHGLKQVGLNYHKVLQYVKRLGLESLYYLEKDGHTVVKEAKVAEIEKSLFWQQY